MPRELHGGARLEEESQRELCMHPVNYIIAENFRLRERKEKAGRRVTKRHVALCADLLPDSPGLTGRERSKLYDTR